MRVEGALRRDRTYNAGEDKLCKRFDITGEDLILSGQLVIAGRETVGVEKVKLRMRREAYGYLKV